LVLGLGVGGLGLGAQAPIPNPQSPIIDCHYYNFNNQLSISASN
jgi:hypothetical protein